MVGVGGYIALPFVYYFLHNLTGKEDGAKYTVFRNSVKVYIYGLLQGSLSVSSSLI